MTMMNLLTIDNLQLGIPALVILFLLYFVIRFLKQYRFPAKQLQKQLRSKTNKVSEISKLPASERRNGLAVVFMGTALEHSWLEFQETLHDQSAVMDGENRIVRTRATTPSSYFFSAQKVIDTPLKTEYFRHLPGILTGIGIIGTFMGLLFGLSYFDPSDPAKVQESLKLLLHGVRDAFVASSVAIIAAMWITNSEKKNLRVCIEYLEGLTDAIDRLFDAGVGEEYLSELVRHTQESSVQTRMLKDSLVTDLREMLENLVEAQVKQNLNLATTLSTSYHESGRDIAEKISDAIDASFRGPLEQLVNSVQNVTSDQSGKVQTLLQDVLVAFMAKLESTFGNQFTGMHEMLGQSISSMQAMQGNFAELVNDMRAASLSSGQAVQEQLTKTLADMHSNQSLMHAAMNDMVMSLQKAVESIGTQGEQAGSRMGEQVLRIFAESEARQAAMAEQMQSFVEGLKESVGKGQQETIERISVTVDRLGSQLDGMLQTFDTGRRAMDAASGLAQQEQQEQISRTLAAMHESQSGVTSAMETLMAGLRSTVSSIGDQGAQAGALIGKELEKQQTDNASRNEAIAARMDEFVGRIQQNITDGQADSIKVIATTVDELGQKLQTVVATFEKNRLAMDGASVANQEKLHSATKVLVEELGTHVRQLLLSLQQGHDATRQTVKLMGEQTERNVQGMQLGADKINAAAGQFSLAGQGIAQIATSSASVATSMQNSAGELAGATREMGVVIDGARSQREAIQHSIGVIEAIIATAQAEGGMRGKVLEDMEIISQQMRVLNLEANKYLEEVTDVLGKSFDSFGAGVDKSLSRSLASFDAELDRAVKVLGGGVQELAENLDTFGEMVEKSTRHHKAA